MVLVEADGVDPEGLERCFACLLHIRRITVHGPAAVARTAVPALGGHQHLVGGTAVGRQGLGDEPFAVSVLLHAEGVGVRGVDDGDPGVQ